MVIKEILYIFSVIGFLFVAFIVAMYIRGSSVEEVVGGKDGIRNLLNRGKSAAESNGYEHKS